MDWVMVSLLLQCPLMLVLLCLLAMLTLRYRSVCVHAHIFMHVYMYAYIYVHVCMYVCMYVLRTYVFVTMCTTDNA